MNGIEMATKLQREDISGTGVRVTYLDGAVVCYFYEDFGEDKGIERAERDFMQLKLAKKAKSIDYFHRVYTAEEVKTRKQDANYLAIGSDGKWYDASYSVTQNEIYFCIPESVEIRGYFKAGKQKGDLEKLRKVAEYVESKLEEVERQIYGYESEKDGPMDYDIELQELYERKRILEKLQEIGGSKE